MIVAIIVCGVLGLAFNLPDIVYPDPHWHGCVYRDDPDE
jgi:hypothetical protein